MGKKAAKENRNLLSNMSQEGADDILNETAEAPKEEQPKKLGGVTFRKLRPEVKQTLEKVVYQLELVAKTLQLLETRVIDSEDKL